MNIKNLYISAGVLAVLAIATSLFKRSDSAPCSTTEWEAL